MTDIKVTKIVQTCSACPSQWDMWDEKENYYYIRYRWGQLRVDSPHGNTIFRKTLDESGWDGVLSTEDMQQILSHMFDWSEAK